MAIHEPDVRVKLAKKRLDAELVWLRGLVDLALAHDLDDEARAAAKTALVTSRDQRVSELARRGSLPLDEVLERFGLDPLDRVLLACALANEVAPDFARRFATLHGGGERGWPTAALAMETFVDARHWPALRARLSPDAPLLRFRLVTLGGDVDYANPLHRPLFVSPRALQHALGHLTLDPTLRAHAEHWPAERAFTTALQLEVGYASALSRARTASIRAEREGRPAPILLLRGPVGAGRRRLVHTLASERGRGTVSFDLTALARDHDGVLEDGLRLALREARLLDAVPCLREWDALVSEQRYTTEDDAPSAGESRRIEDVTRTLVRALDGFDGPVALLSEDTYGRTPPLKREVLELQLGMPSAKMATTIWRGTFADQLEPELATRLGQTFVLTPGQIEDAAAAVWRDQRFAPERAIDYPVVHEVVKQQLRTRLGDVATLVTRRYGWHELVADNTVKVQLRELVSRHRHHHRVMDEWRFSERFGRATGISALFEGPPGTGKTMAASIIAGELGLDLFQVDLSQVISKYIGETEKQLARLFDEAERAGAVILFDEADSLFSKRTQVSSSNDRYSNLKVNFLLQRIERFTGVAVLTTNFPESMDEAFGRRVTVRVRFAQPGPEQRVHLWQTMLARCDVLGGDVDFEALAQDFDLSGGLIRNAVLRAAYMAASRSGTIDHELLVLAARIELKQQGKLLVGDPLGDLAARYGADV